MSGSFLGPSFSNKEIKNILDKKQLVYKYLDDEKLFTTISKNLANGKSLGLFQGRMEFGPRALGGRSIIADPRQINMQKKLNLQIKFRESFRPFAPAVLEENVNDWFELNEKSPYMLLVSNVKNKHLKIPKSNLKGLNKVNEVRSILPAITHVDNSARIQTVNKSENPFFYKLIYSFKKITKVPVLINTSFNIRGEPIVCTPEDAIQCFLGTHLDMLLLENYFLIKENQPTFLIKSYLEQIPLD